VVGSRYTGVGLEVVEEVGLEVGKGEGFGAGACKLVVV
jgi:hypothetical protein